MSDIRYAMQNRQTVSPDDLTAAKLRSVGCMSGVCVLPEPFNERASYLADILVQMVARKPKDDDLRFVVGRLCQTLGYTLNSASWREGELHDFDLQEVRRKLQPLVSGGPRPAERTGRDYDTSPTLASRAKWTSKAEESEHNARLIAAAPDLLAACKAYLRAMARYGHPDKTGRLIRAAVEKAETTPPPQNS